MYGWMGENSGRGVNPALSQKKNRHGMVVQSAAAAKQNCSKPFGSNVENLKESAASCDAKG